MDGIMRSVFAFGCYRRLAYLVISVCLLIFGSELSGKNHDAVIDINRIFVQVEVSDSQGIISEFNKLQESKIDAPN